MTSLPARRHQRAWTRAAAGVGALALLAVGSSSMAEPDPTYPNAPQHGNGGFGPAYSSATLTYAKPSKQWLRLPDVVLAVSVDAFTTHPGAAPASCLQKYGPTLCEPAPGAETRLVSDALTYPVATLPANHRDARFDRFPDATVKTVAFGAVPVEATLSLTLPIDAEGLPIGLRGVTISDQYDPDTTPAPPEVPNPTQLWMDTADTTVTGSVWVRLKALSVDGIPVDLGDHCRTTEPAALDLIGKGFISNQYFGDVVPDGAFTVGFGGTLTGTIDVPHFVGCGTGGDDLSPLVSSMASGSGFSVKVVTSELDGADCFGADPDTTNWSLCPAPPNLPIPTIAP